MEHQMNADDGSAAHQQELLHREQSEHEVFCAIETLRRHLLMLGCSVYECNAESRELMVRHGLVRSMS